MSPTLDAFLCSWPWEPWLLVAVLVPAAVYLRGWLILRRRDPRRWHDGPLAAFLGGLAAIYVALASPIEPFADLLLQVHMVQHLLLMMVAPPLLWLGEPLFPLLRGLPRSVRVAWAGPLLSAPALRRFFGRLTNPLPALLLFIAATWVWHLPPVYDLALRSTGWHYLEHACFLGTGLLFWYPVVRPYPARPRWSPWLLLPYLMLADLSNTALGALLTFSGRVLYPYYAEVPRLVGLSPLDDQSAAGVIMWVPGSVAFLLPLAGIGVQLLSGEALRRLAPEGRRTVAPGESASPGERAAQNGLEPRRGGGHRLNAPPPSPLRGSNNSQTALSSPGLEDSPGATVRRPSGATKRLALPLVAPHRATNTGFDLLRIPLLGRFLKWRHARFCLQLPLFLLAGLVIYDGLRGPPVGALNLAGVLPWIHWRGLLVLGLLAAGNVFCTACPFLLPRTLARRFLPARWSWPRRLRSKWLAVLLIVAFLWAYEALALWDRPAWTACIALSYFAAALVIDGLFRGAAFCKYVCPIGQFNFVQSLVSPLEVRARDSTVCASCRTRDCIRGRDGIPGCELHLFLPRKAGNLDCTTCLDCVHACPHDNVGLVAGPPGAELWNDRQRSGVGRFSRRPDLAALVVVLVFGAFANAAGMVGPVMGGQERLAGLVGIHSPLLMTTAFDLLAVVVLPLLAVGAAAALSRRWGRSEAGTLAVAVRYAYALVPLGFGMWLAHYGYHFLTSYDTAVPTAQRFLGDLGWTALGKPHWVAACCRPVVQWLPHLEIVFLDGGLLLSLYTAYRIALARSPRLAHALGALAPWALLIVLLFALGVWIVVQPMDMRGTLPG